MTDRVETADIRLARLVVDPTENAERSDPTLPIDRTDPTEPIDSTEPREQIDKMELWERNDHNEPSVWAMEEASSRSTR
jgi:hypothetical protein